MDFSEAFRFSGLAEWSPDGKFVALAADYRLVIRDTATLQIVQLFTCLDSINVCFEHPLNTASPKHATIASLTTDIAQLLDWSFDSKYVLCSMIKRGTVQVCTFHPSLVNTSGMVTRFWHRFGALMTRNGSAKLRKALPVLPTLAGAQTGGTSSTQMTSR
jgi:hypothetical protein